MGLAPIWTTCCCRIRVVLLCLVLLALGCAGRCIIYTRRPVRGGREGLDSFRFSTKFGEPGLCRGQERMVRIQLDALFVFLRSASPKRVLHRRVIFGGHSAGPHRFPWGRRRRPTWKPIINGGSPPCLMGFQDGFPKGVRGHSRLRPLPSLLMGWLYRDHCDIRRQHRGLIIRPVLASVLPGAGPNPGFRRPRRRRGRGEP